MCTKSHLFYVLVRACAGWAAEVTADEARLPALRDLTLHLYPRCLDIPELGHLTLDGQTTK